MMPAQQRLNSRLAVPLNFPSGAECAAVLQRGAELLWHRLPRGAGPERLPAVSQQPRAAARAAGRPGQADWPPGRQQTWRSGTEL